MEVTPPSGPALTIMRLPANSFSSLTSALLKLLFFDLLDPVYSEAFVSLSVTEDEVTVVGPAPLLGVFAERDDVCVDDNEWRLLSVERASASPDTPSPANTLCDVSSMLASATVSAFFVAGETYVHVLVPASDADRATAVLQCKLDHAFVPNRSSDGAPHVRLWRSEMVHLVVGRDKHLQLAYPLLASLFSGEVTGGELLSFTVSAASIEVVCPATSLKVLDHPQAQITRDELGDSLRYHCGTLVEYCDAVQHANEQPGIAASILHPLHSQEFEYVALSTHSTDFVILFQTPCTEAHEASCDDRFQCVTQLYRGPFCILDE